MLEIGCGKAQVHQNALGRLPADRMNDGLRRGEVANGNIVAEVGYTALRSQGALGRGLGRKGANRNIVAEILDFTLGKPQAPVGDSSSADLCGHEFGLCNGFAGKRLGDFRLVGRGRFWKCDGL